MPRGRRAKPAEIKALLGNPGKRRLALKGERGKGILAVSAKAMPIQPLDWLNEQETKLFQEAVGSLPPNLVRSSDRQAFGRWSCWMFIFITCKNALEGKKHWYTTSSEHSPEIHREHPLSKKMDKAEAHLIPLEDRLCLNIVARNNVMHRLFNMPAAHPGGGGLFTPDSDEDDKKAAVPTDAAEPVVDDADLDPRGFLARAGKQHATH